MWFLQAFLILWRTIQTFGRREKWNFLLMPLPNPQPFPPKSLLPRLQPSTIPSNASYASVAASVQVPMEKKANFLIRTHWTLEVWPSPNLLVADVMCPNYLTFRYICNILFSFVAWEIHIDWLAPIHIQLHVAPCHLPDGSFFCSEKTGAYLKVLILEAQSS